MSYISPFDGNVIQPTDVSYASYNLTADLPLLWPGLASGTQSPAARIMDVYQNASWTLSMPNATQASVGQDALIRNTSSTSVTVLNFTGGVICTVAGGQSQYIYLTVNSTSGGNWGVIAFGSTTSSSNSAQLAGLGLLAITSTLNQSHPVGGFATGYQFTANDRAQTKLWTGGSGTATLPSASVLGNNWFAIFKNGGAGSLTISPPGGQFIDNITSKVFQPDESAFIMCDGSSYYTIGYGQSTSFFFTALVKPVVSGTYTLTTYEISSIIQEYTGTLTGNVTVIYPQVVNLYVIANRTIAGGNSLVVTTGASGSAQATIPAGQQVTLVCDGTNFYNANTVQAGAVSTSLVNGSVGSPALNFVSELTTGIYRSGTGQFDISILGVNRFNLNATTGLSIVGAGNFTGGISGGTF